MKKIKAAPTDAIFLSFFFAEGKKKPPHNVRRLYLRYKRNLILCQIILNLVGQNHFLYESIGTSFR